MSEFHWYRIGPADDIELGSLRGARIQGHRVCIGRAELGFFAVEDTCPHAGGSLSTGLIDGREIVCPLHVWGFDVETGESPEDPNCPLRVYPVRVEGDELEIQLPAPS